MSPIHPFTALTAVAENSFLKNWNWDSLRPILYFCGATAALNAYQSYWGIESSSSFPTLQNVMLCSVYYMALTLDLAVKFSSMPKFDVLFES